MSNFPQNAGANPEPAHDKKNGCLISSLNPDDPCVTWINAGALDLLSRLQRDGRLFELRAFTSLTATDLNDIQRTLFKDCVKKTLTLSGRIDHEKRACEALRHLARTLPLLFLTHSKMEIRDACNEFLKGAWPQRSMREIMLFIGKPMGRSIMISNHPWPQRSMRISLEQMHGQRSCSPG